MRGFVARIDITEHLLVQEGLGGRTSDENLRERLRASRFSRTGVAVGGGSKIWGQVLGTFSLGCPPTSANSDGSHCCQRSRRPALSWKRRAELPIPLLNQTTALQQSSFDALGHPQNSSLSPGWTCSGPVWLVVVVGATQGSRASRTQPGSSAPSEARGATDRRVSLGRANVGSGDIHGPDADAYGGHHRDRGL